MNKKLIYAVGLFMLFAPACETIAAINSRVAIVMTENVTQKGKYDFVVAKDNSGDFNTVQEAINAVPDFRKNVRTTILVKKGVMPASETPLRLKITAIGEM